MGKIVPFISSGVSGPLGVIHLPRLWSKLLLGAKGLLPEGYDTCGAGFDQMVLDALGLNREATIGYIQGSLPSYTEFEKWILEQNGGKLDMAAVDRLNKAIAGYEHREAVRRDILAAAGLPDDGTITTAVKLNELDDWTELHRQVTAG